MKFNKIHIVIFLITFITSVSIVPLEKRNADETLSTVIEVKIDDAKIETNVNENYEKPQVFQINGFWDELENQYNKHLLEVGEVSNGENFKVKSGETWLGLYGEDGNRKLLSTKISVTRPNKDDLSWKVISTLSKKENEPLFLVKNLKKVKTGSVKTLFSGYTWNDADEGKGEVTSLKKDFVKKFDLGERSYTLRTEKGIDENQQSVLVLILDDGKKSQIIYYINYFEDGDYVGNLYWAGDVDSDGKLDLFMDFWNYEKGGYSSGLFLSSEAKKGKLVKLFEYFALLGC